MGRRPLPVGTHGSFSYRTLGPRKVRAMTQVRDVDGRTRQVTREGTSKQDARGKVLEAITDRPGFTGSTLTADTRISVVGRAWLDELDRLVELGHRAPNTTRIYRGNLELHVIPAIGELRLREATVPRLDGFVQSMRASHTAALTKTSRTVLNGLLGHAVRQGAIENNPMREVGRIRGDRRRTARALTPVERDRWLARMEADDVAARHDLPDLTRFLLSTGVRIGECLAVTFDEVDVGAKQVAIDFNIVRIRGRGLHRMRTKTSAGERTLRLPGWAVDMLIRRGEAAGWSGPVFPSRATRGRGGSWRDPSNTSRSFREARARAGFEWVTSHVFRRSVATILDESGLTAREIADQLGHARPSMTMDVYMGRKAVGGAGATALEDVWGDDPVTESRPSNRGVSVERSSSRDQLLPP